jgi:hypothetical protein
MQNNSCDCNMRAGPALLLQRLSQLQLQPVLSIAACATMLLQPARRLRPHAICHIPVPPSVLLPPLLLLLLLLLGCWVEPLFH